MLSRLQKWLAKTPNVLTRAHRRSESPGSASPPRVRPSALGNEIEAILYDRRLYAPAQAQIDRVKRLLPEYASRTKAAAGTFLLHEFDLLGSGVFVSADPERAVRASGYAPMDWYLDPVSGRRFPRGVFYRDWDLERMRPGTADIKLPWELSRCQHWVTLAQACRLSGDPTYAKEIENEVQDFMEVNPVGCGINWTCTMDVALRALNWAVAFELLKGCKTPDPICWRSAYEHLFDHGTFIRGNLEDRYEVTSNHYLSNIVGLFYLGSVFAGLPEGREWLSFGRNALEREIHEQVLDDGADFESSVPYHRLVTELFLGAARLAGFNREPFSDAYTKKLRQMVDFLIGVMRPDGLMPQIGDADDGRLHRFDGLGRWQPQDARHLLAPAALLLGTDDWLSLAGEEGLWEAAWWGFDLPSSSIHKKEPGEGFHLFRDAGIAVSRRDGDYLIVTNGVVGTRGFGNHKHNDQLGFEFHACGLPLLVDPGSYVYTSSPEARNLFRSTAYHNTLSIDGEEQNEMNAAWLFRLFEKAHPEHIYFFSDERISEYRGRHTGYSRLQAPVTHERLFRHDRHTHSLVVRDFLRGSGLHRLRWHFHFAPGVGVEEAGSGRCRLRTSERSFELVSREGLSGRLSDAWYSPSYGVRLPCVALDIEIDAAIDDSTCWTFCIAPEDEVEWLFSTANLANTMGSK